MSERRYTVTEGQLRDLFIKYSTTQLTVRELVSTLTPDPEPSGEVVERIRKAMGCIWLDGDTMGASIQGEEQAVKNLSALLTAEVTRQVEERTRGLREALSNVSKAEQAICYSQSVALTREFELMSALRQCGDIARQALANKGGSDD